MAAIRHGRVQLPADVAETVRPRRRSRSISWDQMCDELRQEQMDRDYAIAEADEVAWRAIDAVRHLERNCAKDGCHVGCPHDPGEGHSAAGYAANH